MKRWMYALPVLAFAVVAFFLYRGLFVTPSEVALPSALINKPAPDIALPPMDAATPGFTRADLAKGHVTVVNFFASWCVPCRVEAPLMMTLSQMPGIALYGVDYEDARQNPAGQDGRAFLSELGNPFSRIVADLHGAVAIDWGVYGVPETYVVDGKGIIRFKWVGPLTPDVLTGQLLPEIEKARQAS
jgi:cytochrome c biogenesis protein CcmG/thiol:disulfide interchange protein DsbE